MDHAALDHAAHAIRLPRGTLLGAEAKRGAYGDLLQALAGVLPGCHGDAVAVMATTACLVFEALPYASFAGFYRVVEGRAEAPPAPGGAGGRGDRGEEEPRGGGREEGGKRAQRAGGGLLRVGPYQGPLGCLEIPFDRGVCGAAARERRTQLVADVNAFPGHIACDAAARSEIVVPIFDRSGELVAVVDVDSHQPAAFDEVDREGLEAAARLLAEQW